MPTPLPLPENYNPQTHLISKPTEEGILHEVRAGTSFAMQLVASGTEEDLALAHKVLDVILSCQEVHDDDPHYGNFMWMLEDDVVGDLNAVEFMLERLIPMMIRHQDRLSPEMQTRVLNSIRLGLDEVRRIDVSVAYSNIVVLDIVNSCLGGELLNDMEIAERGYQKLIQWMAFTDQHGTIMEANSPTYIRVIINALKLLIELGQDEPSRIRARTAMARLGLSVALHIHRSTGRWAGPHTRAYHPTVVAETPAEIDMLRDWLSEGALPAWIEDLLDYPTEPFEIIETANATLQGSTTTYHTSSYCLGLSSREYGDQSDVLMAHYVREGADRPGIMYTRYVMDEKWLGDFFHSTDRTKTRNLVEEGRFFGIQQGSRAIGLYRPINMRTCSSAKATFVFTQSQLIDEIWVDDEKIETLPANVQDGQTVVIGSGSAYIGIRLLTRTDKGRNAPLRLVEKDGDLVLEIYNYKGSQKRFWEMQPEWTFFQGFTQCGVYVEVAERTDYPDGKAFSNVIRHGNVIDTTDAPFTYDGKSKRLWNVEYERDGETIGIEIDLMAWQIMRRWTQDGDLGWDMLKTPISKQNKSGEICVGDARLTCEAESAWLYANPDTNRYVIGYHGQHPSPITLTLPAMQIEIDNMGTGTITVDNGEVTIDALKFTGDPKITRTIPD